MNSNFKTMKIWNIINDLRKGFYKFVKTFINLVKFNLFIQILKQMIAEDEKILFVCNARVIAISKNITKASKGGSIYRHRLHIKKSSRDHTKMHDVRVLI